MTETCYNCKDNDVDCFCCTHCEDCCENNECWCCGDEAYVHNEDGVQG